ncbi:MAG: hypothetical protein K2K57_00005, partial [Oscillospiraceae bacterium]|nr:hypothetical protein [Oscillospiraceae bacterium]
MYNGFTAVCKTTLTVLIALHHTLMMTIAYLFDIQSESRLPKAKFFGNIAFPHAYKRHGRSLRR